MTDTAGTALFHQTMPFTVQLGIEVLEHSADVSSARSVPGTPWPPRVRCTRDAA